MVFTRIGVIWRSNRASKKSYTCNFFIITQLYLYFAKSNQWWISVAGAARTTYGVPLGPGWPQDHALMDGPRKFRTWKIRKNRKDRLRPILLYYGRTRAPTDMVGVPMDQAWPENYAGAIKNPDFQIRTELEPDNRFPRFALLCLNQGTYRHLQGTCKSGLT